MLYTSKHMSKKRSFFSRYVQHVRSSSIHVQQIHAVIFAGGLTVALAVTVLYFEYGFWREKYDSKEVVIKQNIEVKSVSPVGMFSTLIKDAGSQISAIKEGGGSFLEGKEVYSKKEEFLKGTTTDER
jgi:hypothetical protein